MKSDLVIKAISKNVGYSADLIARTIDDFEKNNRTMLGILPGTPAHSTIIGYLSILSFIELERNAKPAKEKT